MDGYLYYEETFAEDCNGFLLRTDLKFSAKSGILF